MSRTALSVLDTFNSSEPDLSAGLSVPETLCLKLDPDSWRASVLDIGAGAGRSTGPLSAMFGKYVGIDVAEKAITVAQTLYPQADLSVMDARNLKFAAESFDCVVFSFNGIDFVDLPDRQVILREVKRVLRPGGFFIYSTHSLSFRRALVWRDRFFVRELVAFRPRNLIPMLTNRVRLFWRQSQDNQNLIGYINEPALLFAMLVPYVDIPEEIKRLSGFGLAAIETIGSGKIAPGYDDSDCWVYIVARKEEFPSQAS